MAFKMNKPSTIQGTAGHRSAIESHLKMSALKATKTYEEAYKEAGMPDSPAKDDKAHFIEKAKEWNMKTYGTHNPTADAKKAGITKAELAKAHKAETSDSSSTSTKTNPVEDTSTIKTKAGTITNTKIQDGGTRATVQSDGKPLNSSDEMGKTVIKDHSMTAEDKAKREKEAADTADTEEAALIAETASKPAAKAPGGTRTKVTAKDGSKTISRGGRVVKTVDAKGNKTRYNKKGEETQGSINRKNKKANKATASAERDASNARRLAERDASRASHDTKVAEKKSDKRAADKISNDAKTRKYLSSNRKKRSDVKREADKLVAQSGDKLRKGQARRSVKRDNKRAAETAAQNAASTKKAKMNKVMDDVEKDVKSSATKKTL